MPSTARPSDLLLGHSLGGLPLDRDRMSPRLPGRLPNLRGAQEALSSGQQSSAGRSHSPGCANSPRWLDLRIVWTEAASKLRGLLCSLPQVESTSELSATVEGAQPRSFTSRVGRGIREPDRRRPGDRAATRRADGGSQDRGAWGDGAAAAGNEQQGWRRLVVPSAGQARTISLAYRIGGCSTPDEARTATHFWHPAEPQANSFTSTSHRLSHLCPSFTALRCLR